ncbi:MAG: mechanosensitive ion channel family protein [Desulfobacterales bacterium]|nr:mechanosensitive ion channel family protein [Desulfobacterales bacterium]MDJ0990084.1 mechanosensitive ion channel family protein [Desulfobacterales bacterium]
MIRPMIGGVILVMLVLGPGFPAAHAAGSARSDDAREESKPGPEKELPYDVEEKRLDRAGEAIGKGIEKIGDSAAEKLGRWVTTEAFYDIRWFKLLICLTAVFAVLLAERVLRFVINTKIKTIPHQEGVISWLRMFFQAAGRPLSLFIWTYGIYAALTPLFPHFKTADGANLVHAVAQRAADISGTVAIVWFLFSLVQLLDARLKRWAASTASDIDEIIVPLVGKSLRLFIVIVGGMVIIKNLTGIEIGPLLASLGIGGLAVALAAKDSIANFFGTVTILFDKPFQVGERIVIETYDGVVESVGFRSSRIRTLTGHLVTIPNEKLVNSTVENIGKRPHIRWSTNFGITYDTPPEKVEEAVAILEAILADHEGMNPEFPPRVFFNGFNDWSLNIMVLMWYHPADYWNYQVCLQRICLEILRRFRAAGIDFAFPSRTVYAAGDDKRILKMMLAGGTPPDMPAP